MPICTHRHHLLLQTLLQRLNRELDITMLMVTHDAEAAQIATRQLLLDQGRCIDQTPLTTAGQGSGRTDV